MRDLKTPRAFTLIELLVVVAIVTLLMSFLLPALGEARRAGRMTICQSNLKQFGVATQSYAADFEDRIWSFTWKKGEGRSQYEDLRDPSYSIAAAAFQAVDIIRRKAGWDEFPRISSWIPHVLYNHLVINDYLGQRLPEPMVVCPEDRYRRQWHDIESFKVGAFLPFQPNPSATNYRWPFSSSYETVPAAYAPEKPTALWQSNSNCYACDPNAVDGLGNRKLSDVWYPSQKVHMHDTGQRHFSKHSYFFALKETQQPLLHFDTSVVVRRTGDSNEGWYPPDPRGGPTVIRYTPKVWELEAKDESGTDIAFGHYRWTRAGLRGLDFGATEIDTSDW